MPFLKKNSEIIEIPLKKPKTGFLRQNSPKRKKLLKKP